MRITNEQELRWPRLDSEKEACWDFVLRLREEFGLDEAGAIERAVVALRASGRAADAVSVARCKPKRKGPDTHVQDVGRAVKERGLGLEAAAGPVDFSEGEFGELDAEELEERQRQMIGSEVVGALFRKVIPSLPSAGWVRRRRELYLRAGDELVSVSGRGARVTAWPQFVERVVEGGWLVRNEVGEVVPVVKGALGVVHGGRLARVLLNATVKCVPKRERRVHYFQWMPGAGDWEVHFKTFVTFASMFCPEVTDHARGAALALLLGECRASISARRQKILAQYRQDTGGRAAFEGMRATLDPRKGKKLGPRKKPVDASLN